MTRISRKQAEDLIGESSVIKSEVYQNKDQIRIIFTLSDDSSLIYTFDVKKKIKEYYLKQKFINNN